MQQERIESKIVFIALALMALFSGLVFYARFHLNIALPTYHEHLSPFRASAVIPKPNNAFEVHYVARMWTFEPAELILPEHADVHLLVSAVDVNHGFEVLGTDLNLMAVPGTVNVADHRFDRPGQ